MFARCEWRLFILGGSERREVVASSRGSPSEGNCPVKSARVEKVKRLTRSNQTHLVYNAKSLSTQLQSETP